MAEDTVSYGTDAPASRAQSTVTYRSDAPGETESENPIPVSINEPVSTASSSGTSRKRPAEIAVTRIDCSVEDPEDPEDMVGPMVRIFSCLGSRRRRLPSYILESMRSVSCSASLVLQRLPQSEGSEAACP